MPVIPFLLYSANSLVTVKIMKKTNSQTGFTLIELLITLVILAILVSIAAPSMQSTVKGNTIQGLQREYLSALNYARSEAVSRGVIVSMCPSSNTETCGADWSDGWLVFVDNGAAAANGVYDVADEELLKVSQKRGKSRVKFVDADNLGTGLNSYSWNFRGFSAGRQRALVVVCDERTEAQFARFARGLLIERSGRVILSRDADNNGVHDSLFEDNAGVVTTQSLDCS